MNSPAAFKATYSDFKLVKTRGVVQVIFEVPLAQSNEVLGILGGMPNAANEQWFGIAAIRSQQEEAQGSRQDDLPQDTLADNPDGDRRNWRDVQPSAQAAMRCDQPAFWAFLREEKKQRIENKDDAATAVRKICHVNSRARFNDNHAARIVWHGLDQEFQAWQAKERVGA